MISPVITSVRTKPDCRRRRGGRRGPRRAARRGRRRRRRRAPRPRRRGRARRDPPVRLRAGRVRRLALVGHRGPRAAAEAGHRRRGRAGARRGGDRRARRGSPTASGIKPGDLSPGDLLPVDDDDPRLVPTYSFGDDPLDADEKAQVRRSRRTSASAGSAPSRRRAATLAAQRWYDGDGGPELAAGPVGAGLVHHLRLPAAHRRPAVRDVRGLRQRRRQRRRPDRVASTTAAAPTPRCGWPRSTSRRRCPSRSFDTLTPDELERSARRSDCASSPSASRLARRRRAVLEAEQPEAEAGQAGPQPPRLPDVLEPAVERQQGEEADQPERRADLDRAHPVDVQRLDVGHEEGAVADLVRASAARRVELHAADPRVVASTRVRLGMLSRP